ncbi:hypothetical protein, partial [Klebsiella pneumoniae]|uniref:hypothetical protein n=1 Tax=Klebsiella pneumoniae TaxID=573 RepID=UPI003CF1CAF5
KSLVDRSLGAVASAGPVLLDADDNKDGPGYADVQALMLSGGAVLKKSGIETRIDTTRAFVGSAEPLMAYVSWGSNDSSFDLRTYRT